MLSGINVATTQVSRYITFRLISEICRGGTSELMTVQVQAEIVQKQAQMMSHAERVLSYICQFNSSITKISLPR